jgi:hypothetical protein
MILIETGCLMYLVARFKRKSELIKEEVIDLERASDFEPDVARERERVQRQDFNGLLRVVNMRKEYN